MTIEQIKAELYDLHYHNCDGRLTLNPDSKIDPNDKPCSMCSRILELHHMLEKAEAAGDGPINGQK